MDLSTGWFSEWFDSPYYHRLYLNRDEREASDFIDRLVYALQPLPESRMLDVACGRGRHARMLAAKGFDVTGIDLSAASIQFAHAFESENLHFYQHDMRLPFRINYYHYAFNFFTSFGYFPTERENENVLRTIARSLTMGGHLMIDYLNARYAEDHLVHRSEKKIDEIQFYITRWFDETHFYKKILIEDEALESPLEFTERVAKYSLGDFTDMLAYQGMQVKQVFGSYLLEPYHFRHSPRLIVLAEKIH